MDLENGLGLGADTCDDIECLDERSFYSRDRSREREIQLLSYAAHLDYDDHLLTPTPSA